MSVWCCYFYCLLFYCQDITVIDANLSRRVLSPQLSKFTTSRAFSPNPLVSLTVPCPNRLCSMRVPTVTSFPPTITTFSSSCRSASVAQVNARSRLLSTALRNPIASETVFIGIAYFSMLALP